MSLPKLIIAIGAEFDNKGFKKADSALVKMAKSAKNLGAALGIAYATKKVVAYTKASMAAAAADQRSQFLLSAQLKNLGLAYANVNSEKFIKDLETQTHIVDDLLRPSYAQLIRVTGTVTETEKIMAAAFDIAAGSTLDYGQTIDILSQAYVGNLKGLKQFNTGLSNAELAALSFDQLLILLNKHFAGAGAASVKGYAGQMAALNIAMGNSQEILGGALLESFAKLAGEGNFTKATSNIEKLSTAFADLFRLMTGVIDANAIFSQVKFGGFLNLIPYEKKRGPAMQSPGERAAAVAAAKKASDEKKRALAAAALAKKLENERKAAAVAAEKAKKNLDDLNKASAIFDMNKISIAAALQSTMDAETKLRLLAMQAIANDNGELALEYERKLGYLQAANYANKLNGITTITNSALDALNKQLFAELQFIDTSDMAHADKEAARQAAFSKYNDALNKSGGLAATITYNQKTQDDLAAIAKLAALSNFGAALETLNKIIKAMELNTIKDVSDAQAIADKVRLDALKAYILKLEDARLAALALAAAANTPKVIVPPPPIVIVPPVYKPPNGGGFFKKENKEILDEIIPIVPPPLISPPGFPSFGEDKEARDARKVTTILPTININAGVIANVDELNLLIQRSIQDMNRNGYNLDVAGAI